MGARRSRTQARRKPGGGMPGWAWLVLGVLLTLGVILAAPRWLQGDGEDGFLRPHADPDARPATASGEDAPEDEIPVPARGDAPAPDQPPQYDFYTVLPGDEVAMSDAELAASAREEEQRRLREQKAAAAAANAAAAAKNEPATTTTPPEPSTPSPSTPAATPTAAAPAVAASGTEARYILQAGAFGASGDAESVKAKIALLGLTARVESAQVHGKTVYRVRMGPYGTAGELAEAKRKLASGGLPALAIRAK